jgi:hypothetical protein
MLDPEASQASGFHARNTEHRGFMSINAYALILPASTIDAPYCIDVWDA